MAAPTVDYIQLLNLVAPGFWGSLSSQQRQQMQRLYGHGSQGNPDTWEKLQSFIAGVQGTQQYAQWNIAQANAQTGGTTPPVGGGGEGGGGSGGTGGGDPGNPSDPGPPPPPPAPTPEQSDLLAQISGLLAQWGLPTSLTSFIQNEITASKGYDEIINDLRNTSEYKAAFPENALRLANGYSAMSEGQILEYRDQAKQIAQVQLGINDVTNADITNLIANNKSLSEWSQNLQTYASFQQWGPAVQQALSQELGYDVSDERTFAFMSPDISTPELNLAYQRALERGQPAALGLGIRPEEEANLLMQYGINPADAFAGYQGIASELPREQRLAFIQASIQGNQDQFPQGADALNGADFSTLFSAIQLKDPTAIAHLSNLMSAEVARFQAGGAVARSGTSAVGLLTPGERQG